MKKNFGTKPWFYPLPVLIIGTYDENGKADAMNAAWGGHCVGFSVLVICADNKHREGIKPRFASKILLHKNYSFFIFSTAEKRIFGLFNQVCIIISD